MHKKSLAAANVENPVAGLQVVMLSPLFRDRTPSTAVTVTAIAEPAFAVAEELLGQAGFLGGIEIVRDGAHLHVSFNASRV